MIKKQEEMIAETWKAIDEVSDLNDNMKREIRKFLIKQKLNRNKI